MQKHKNLIRCIACFVMIFAIIGGLFTAHYSTIYVKYLLNSITKNVTAYDFVPISDTQLEIDGFAFIEENKGTLNRLKAGRSYSEGIDIYTLHNAGGRIRFRTNSKTIAISSTLNNIVTVPWFSLYGSAGLDVYTVENEEKIYKTTVSPYDTTQNWLQQIVDIGSDDIVDVVITLPSYASVKSMEIGFEKNCVIEIPTPYTIEKPIVFYGSSITQGSSASRGSLAFPSLVSDHFNADFINLGFSGSAKGEQMVATDIAEIDMSAFVMEYDHNAETPDDLRSTHYDFYKTVRNSQPNVPIILLSRISSGYSISTSEAQERNKIIKETYEKAISDGDTNIYFIDGCSISLGEAGLLADGKHPNDLGMRKIADAIIDALEKTL